MARGLVRRGSVLYLPLHTDPPATPRRAAIHGIVSERDRHDGSHASRRDARFHSGPHHPSGFAGPAKHRLRRIADQVGLGVPFENAVESASERIGLPDFRFLAVALNVQHTTGGNLAATLENLSELIRKRRALRLKAAAATAEVRMSAYVLGALPIVTMGALLLFRPEYVVPLFYDRRGNYILAAAAILLMLAFLTMRQMVRRVTAA